MGGASHGYLNFVAANGMIARPQGLIERPDGAVAMGREVKRSRWMRFPMC